MSVVTCHVSGNSTPGTWNLTLETPHPSRPQTSPLFLPLVGTSDLNRRDPDADLGFILAHPRTDRPADRCRAGFRRSVCHRKRGSGLVSSGWDWFYGSGLFSHPTMVTNRCEPPLPPTEFSLHFPYIAGRRHFWRLTCLLKLAILSSEVSTYAITHFFHGFGLGIMKGTRISACLFVISKLKRR